MRHNELVRFIKLKALWFGLFENCQLRPFLTDFSDVLGYKEQAWFCFYSFISLQIKFYLNLKQ